jgi:hypothetical protein
LIFDVPLNFGLVMSHNEPPTPSLFSQFEIGSHDPLPPRPPGAADEQTRLLREILAALDRQSELLEELVSQVAANQRQRTTELGQWKEANPRLARDCRRAAESLAQVQTEFLQALTDEINRNAEEMLDGEFLLNEFIDRFGPRLAHLNGVLQVLSQLSSTNPTNAS